MSVTSLHGPGKYNRICLACGRSFYNGEQCPACGSENVEDLEDE